MANTMSAKKAVRQSARKRTNNVFWKKRIKNALRAVKVLVDSKADSKQITQELSMLQKVLDKAAKEKVIHKNKANRLKSKYAQKLSGFSKQISESPKSQKEPKQRGRKPKSQS